MFVQAVTVLLPVTSSWFHKDLLPSISLSFLVRNVIAQEYAKLTQSCFVCIRCVAATNTRAFLLTRARLYMRLPPGYQLCRPIPSAGMQSAFSLPSVFAELTTLYWPLTVILPLMLSLFLIFAARPLQFHCPGARIKTDPSTIRLSGAKESILWANSVIFLPSFLLIRFSPWVLSLLPSWSYRRSFQSVFMPSTPES